MTSRSDRTGAWGDGATGLLLFAVIVGYLHAFPRNLNEADEAYFLFESKSILNGEVLYRDVFWFAMPLAHWIMALVYAVFGVSMDVSRMAFAVLHALTGIGLFLVCRRLGVRRPIAVIPAIAHLALCQSTWPYASPHWFSTVFMVLILYVMLGRAWVKQPARALFVGMSAAALTAVHQQKGAAFCAALAGFFVADYFIRRRFGVAEPSRVLWRRVLFFVAGVASVVMPILAIMIGFAGFDTVFDQTFIHPLTGYRTHNYSPWAGVNLMTVRYARYTIVPILKYAPIVIAFGAIRLLFAWMRRVDLDRAANLLALVVICSAGILSIGYLPDIIHVSFIAPLFFVFWAETAEASVRTLGRIMPYPVVWGGALASVALILLGLHLHHNLTWGRQEFSFSYQTIFGRVDLSNDKPVHLIEAVQAEMRDAHPRQLFIYPIYASLYLMTDTDNPARQQFLLPGFHSEEHFKDTLQRVDASHVAHIVACDLPFQPNDPIRAYIQEHFDPVDSGPGPADGFIKCTLYRRRPTTTDAG